MVMEKYRIRNEHIRGTTQADCCGDKVREAILGWFRRVQRSVCGYIGGKTLEVELPDKRSRRRPKRRCMDVLKKDMKLVSVREEDAEGRARWKRMIRCGEQAKVEEDKIFRIKRLH